MTIPCDHSSPLHSRPYRDLEWPIPAEHEDFDTHDPAFDYNRYLGWGQESHGFMCAMPSSTALRCRFLRVVNELAERAEALQRPDRGFLSSFGWGSVKHPENPLRTLIADIEQVRMSLESCGCDVDNALKVIERAMRLQASAADIALLGDIYDVVNTADRVAGRGDGEAYDSPIGPMTDDEVFDSWLRGKPVVLDMPSRFTIREQVSLSFRTNFYWNRAERFFTYDGWDHEAYLRPFIETFEVARQIRNTAVPNVRAVALLWVRMVAAYARFASNGTMPVKREIEHLVYCALSIAEQYPLYSDYLDTAFRLCTELHEPWLIAHPCQVRFVKGLMVRGIASGWRDFENDHSLVITSEGWKVLGEEQVREQERSGFTPATTGVSDRAPKVDHATGWRVEGLAPAVVTFAECLEKNGQVTSEGRVLSSANLKLFMEKANGLRPGQGREPAQVVSDCQATHLDWLGKWIFKPRHGVFGLRDIPEVAPQNDRKRSAKLP